MERLDARARGLDSGLANWPPRLPHRPAKNLVGWCPSETPLSLAVAAVVFRVVYQIRCNSNGARQCSYWHIGLALPPLVRPLLSREAASVAYARILFAPLRH